jgi:hypothetical protein
MKNKIMGMHKVALHMHERINEVENIVMISDDPVLKLNYSGISTCKACERC